MLFAGAADPSVFASFLASGALVLLLARVIVCRAVFAGEYRYTTIALLFLISHCMALYAI